MRLNEIYDNPGARTEKDRVGRGIGSGKGKTSGRGGKGQTARTGVALRGFEGGQTPLIRRLPKRGFVNIHRRKFAEISLERLQQAIDQGKLASTELINGDSLQKSRLLKQVYDGIRVLGPGPLTHRIMLEVAGITQSAREAVENAGGTCRLLPTRAEKLQSLRRRPNQREE